MDINAHEIIASVAFFFLKKQANKIYDIFNREHPLLSSCLPPTLKD